MASVAGSPARSRLTWRLQTPRVSPLVVSRDGLERWLEMERDQLPLWLPVMVGAGVAAWFALPLRWQWEAAALGALAFAAAMLALWRGGRAGVSLAVAGVAIAAGVGLAWWRAERVASPVLERPVVVHLKARIDRVEPLPARQLVRLRLAPLAATAVTGDRDDGRSQRPCRRCRRTFASTSPTLMCRRACRAAA